VRWGDLTKPRIVFFTLPFTTIIQLKGFTAIFHLTPSSAAGKRGGGFAFFAKATTLLTVRLDEIVRCSPTKMNGLVYFLLSISPLSNVKVTWFLLFFEGEPGWTCQQENPFRLQLPQAAPCPSG